MATAARPGHGLFLHQQLAARAAGRQPASRPQAFLWSVLSLIALLGGTGLVLFVVGRYDLLGWHRVEEEEPGVKLRFRPPEEVRLTPAQRATAWYFLVVAGLFLLQGLLGGANAHYHVEPGGFYGFDLGDWLPYNLTRTWHVQLALFFVAASFLAMGIFIAPMIAGREPQHQDKLAIALFGALVVVVVGSLAGEAASIKDCISRSGPWFWLGAQGWEYLDLGRLWQILLVVGHVPLGGDPRPRPVEPAGRRAPGQPALSVPLQRAVDPALLRRRPGLRQETQLRRDGFLAVLGGPPVGRGLSWSCSPRSWWPTSSCCWAWCGRPRPRGSSISTSSSTPIGGVIGTMHHLYFSGAPAIHMALGAFFSAMEVIPLLLLTFEAWRFMRLGGRPGRGSVLSAASADFPHKWAVMFLIAVGFWNFLGAGVFGFLINLPIVSYYEIGTQFTANHAHGAMMGVYGMLAIGLLHVRGALLHPARPQQRTGHEDLVLEPEHRPGCDALREPGPDRHAAALRQLPERLLARREPAFFQEPLIRAIEWLRLPGDLLFIVGGILPVVYLAIRMFLARGRYARLPAGAETERFTQVYQSR